MLMQEVVTIEATPAKVGVVQAHHPLRAALLGREAEIAVPATDVEYRFAREIQSIKQITAFMIGNVNQSWGNPPVSQRDAVKPLNVVNLQPCSPFPSFSSN
jgi:hypothetical protein